MEASTWILSYIIGIMLLLTSVGVGIHNVPNGILFNGIGLVTFGAGTFIMGMLTGRDVKFK